MPNPAWVTRAIAASYETMEQRVPPNWLPKLAKTKSKGINLVGALKEFGCGSYGCVLPTLDSATVLKVTTDQTEAQFAADTAATLVVKVTVDYRMVMRLAAERQGRTIYLLWRESADEVGAYQSPLIDAQHKAAETAYIRMHKTGEIDRASIDRWRASLREMAKDPELEFVASGMLRVFDQQGVFFGDVHSGNLGVVRRRGNPTRVIIDPGHISKVQS